MDISTLLRFLPKLLSIEGWENLFDRLRPPLRAEILKSCGISQPNPEQKLTHVDLEVLVTCNRPKDHTIKDIYLVIEGYPGQIPLRGVSDGITRHRESYPTIKGKGQRLLVVTFWIPQEYTGSIKPMNEGKPHPFKIILKAT